MGTGQGEAMRLPACPGAVTGAQNNHPHWFLEPMYKHPTLGSGQHPWSGHSKGPEATGHRWAGNKGACPSLWAMGTWNSVLEAH